MAEADGGGPVWTTLAVDPGLGLVYLTTGNAAPDLNGIHRQGDNLYTASIVAIDLNSGEYRWHFQEVHHDIWDYDGPQPAVLFTLEQGGQPIPAERGVIKLEVAGSHSPRAPSRSRLA
ncbi:MAG: hypothetical protein M5U01_22085 [Ardenticatenaceae bacterium]|nr:hypothetical protein [Ardenticatenaceae bacterium]